MGCHRRYVRKYRWYVTSFAYPHVRYSVALLSMAIHCHRYWDNVRMGLAEAQKLQERVWQDLSQWQKGYHPVYLVDLHLNGENRAELFSV